MEKAKELLPPEKPKHGGRVGKDNRMMLNGILYWLNTGAPSTAKFRPPQQMPIQSQEMRIVSWAENCYTKIVEKAHECRHLFSFAQGPPWPRAPAKISTTLFPCLRFRRGHTAALGRRPHTADQPMGKGSLLYENWFYWTRNYGKTHGKESDEGWL